MKKPTRPLDALDHMDAQLDQPYWCCQPCGEAFGNLDRVRKGHLSTWHPDTCGVCGKHTSVTEPRDFGYLKPEWKLAAWEP